MSNYLESLSTQEHIEKIEDGLCAVTGAISQLQKLFSYYEPMPEHDIDDLCSDILRCINITASETCWNHLEMAKNSLNREDTGGNDIAKLQQVISTEQTN